PTLYYNTSRRIYGQLVTCDLGVQSGHLSSAPGEQINILSQTGLQLFPRQVGDPCADLHSSGRVHTKGNKLELAI
ncbi:hypothetical protein A2U01_0075845, partial [Trifolium medium]|nr:hypothetical protein [Trifolium medium]